MYSVVGIIRNYARKLAKLPVVATNKSRAFWPIKFVGRDRDVELVLLVSVSWPMVARHKRIDGENEQPLREREKKREEKES